MARWTLFWKLASSPAARSAAFVGDGAAQVVDPGLVGLREVAEHVVLDELLVAGMADADPHAPVIVAAMGGDRAKAVVAGIAAADLHPELGRREGRVSS